MDVGIGALIGAGKLFLDGAKWIMEPENTKEGAEMKLLYGRLVDAFRDAQAGLHDANELLRVRNDELRAKDVDIQDLKNELNFKAGLRKYKGFWYDVEDDGSLGLQPYCNTCQTKDRILMPMKYSNNLGSRDCPGCEQNYTVDAEAYKAARPSVKRNIKRS
jgi:hypothetical protein